MADSLVPGGGNIPIDHNTPVGGVGNIGAFLEITPNTSGPSDPGVKWARFYLNGNEIKIPPGLAHHRIIISENTTTPTHYCKKIQNVIDYEGMWFDKGELKNNNNTYYYIMCPSKRYYTPYYENQYEVPSYNCCPNEEGLLAYSYISNEEYYDDTLTYNYEWEGILSSPGIENSTLGTAINVPWNEGFNAETDSNDNERNSSTFENHNFNQNAPNNLMLSYGTFRLVNALADIDPYKY